MFFLQVLAGVFDAYARTAQSFVVVVDDNIHVDDDDTLSLSQYMDQRMYLGGVCNIIATPATFEKICVRIKDEMQASRVMSPLVIIEEITHTYLCASLGRVNVLVRTMCVMPLPDIHLFFFLQVHSAVTNLVITSVPAIQMALEKAKIKGTL